MASDPPMCGGDRSCARADYPPQVHSVDFLGEVRDANQSRSYARTHGCSTLLNYEPVFLFNDTFEISTAPNSSRLEYTPIASITAAFGTLSDPTVTTYPTYTDTRHIPQFIPFSRAEKAEGAASGCYLTVFNSIVQVPERETGVVWFMKMKSGRSGGRGTDVFCGVGVAEVRIDGAGALGCNRKGDLVFNGFGPRWGDISTIIHGDYIYLYGSGTPTSFANDGTCSGPIYQATSPTTTDTSKLDVPVYLCRVPHSNRAYWHAENYRYWNGEDFVDFPRASQSLVASSHHHQGRFIPPPPPEFKCVMKNVQSGTVIHTQLFTERGHFIFIGCELGGGGGDKKNAMVKMRLADEPMGPWFGEASLFDLNATSKESKNVKFGVHAHPWASDLGNGEIMVSWTEPWPGSVEMARVRLVMQPSLPRIMVSPGTATTTTIAQTSGHCRKNAVISFDDYFNEDPIPEDVEPKPEPEPGEGVGVDQELKFRERDKARNKALAKLAGVYNREEDSDSDTESVFDFKAAFQNLLAPHPAPRSASPSSVSSRPPSPPPAQTPSEGSSTSPTLRPYSGYDLRTIIPEDLSGSWILQERDCHYSDDALHNSDNRDQQITVPQREPEAAAEGDNHNCGSTSSSPQSNNQYSWFNDSDTNTEYSASVSPASSPITIAPSPPRRCPPPVPNMCPCPLPRGTSPPLPGIKAAIGGSPLSTFETHSSSWSGSTTSATPGKGKKYAVKKLLWGKETREEVEEAVGDGNEKKGWKNSIKKSAIAKFLMGGQ